MAIGFVRAVTVQLNGGGAVVTPVLSGAVAGNKLVLASAVWKDDGASNIPDVTSSPALAWRQDAIGGRVTSDPADTGLAANQASITSADVAATGDVSVTATWGGPNTYATLTLAEFSGVASGNALDASAASSGRTLTPSVGPSPATTGASDLVVALFSASANVPGAIGIDATETGYTRLGTDQDAGTVVAYASDYKIGATPGSQSAAWGTLVDPGNLHWSTVLAAYRVAPPVPITGSREDAAGASDALVVRVSDVVLRQDATSAADVASATGGTAVASSSVAWGSGDRIALQDGSGTLATQDQPATPSDALLTDAGEPILADDGSTLTVETNDGQRADVAGAGDATASVMSGASARLDAAGTSDVGVSSLAASGTRADASGTTDATTTFAATVASRADATGGTDAAVDASGTGRILSDAGVASDAATVQATATVARADATASNDTVLGVVQSATVVSDAATASDAVADQGAAGVVRADGAGAGDTVATVVVARPTRDDATTTTDASSASLATGTASPDAVTWGSGDRILLQDGSGAVATQDQAAASGFIERADAASTGDDATSRATFNAAQTDATGTNDARTGTNAISAAVADGGGVSDAATPSQSGSASRADAAGVADARDVTGTGPTSRSDAVAATDGTSSTAAHVLSLADGAGVADLTAGQLAAAVATTDATATGDAAAAGQASTGATADATAANDARAVSAIARPSTTDTASTGDRATEASGIERDVFDGAAVFDAATVQAAGVAARADAATAADATSRTLATSGSTAPDAVGTADTASHIAGLGAPRSDVTVTADTATNTLASGAVRADVSEPTDGATVQAAGVPSRADAAGAGDGAANTLATSAARTDATGALDAGVGGTATNQDRRDATGADDDAVAVHLVASALADGIGAGDGNAVLLDAVPVRFDETWAYDAARTAADLADVAEDAAGASDAAEATNAIDAAMLDAAGAQQGVFGRPVRYVSLADPVAAGDAGDSLWTIVARLADSARAADNPTAGRPVPPAEPRDPAQAIYDLIAPMVAPWRLVWAHQDAPRPPLPYCAIHVERTTEAEHIMLRPPEDDGLARVTVYRLHGVELNCFGRGGVGMARAVALRIKLESALMRAARLGLAVTIIRPAMSVPALLDKSRYEERGMLEFDVSQLGDVLDDVGVIERADIPCEVVPRRRP